jgi:tRNA isopentenyl-2-thiomethyl-A-37 hydroxylase MiaE
MASAQSPMQLTKHQYDDRAEFIEQLTKLIKEEYHEIYRILKRNNERIYVRKQLYFPTLLHRLPPA